MYMYVHVCIFMYMYIACTYMFILVHNFINMYIHVCTMYRALCTDLQILVHVVRIPDVLILQSATLLNKVLLTCNAWDGYQMMHKHHENVPLHAKCNNLNFDSQVTVYACI